MSETPLERIMRVTGRRPSSCDCPRCRKQCKTPCLGTPQDIMRLMEAGYADYLRPTYWCVAMLYEKMSLPIPMVQIRVERRGCPLQHEGLCELHDKGLKPTEGRLSYHTITLENWNFDNSLSWNVAREWLRKENVSLVEEILERWVKTQKEPKK